jgi:hypothetical protein
MLRVAQIINKTTEQILAKGEWFKDDLPELRTLVVSWKQTGRRGIAFFRIMFSPSGIGIY